MRQGKAMLLFPALAAALSAQPAGTASLDQTMQILQEELGAIGRVSFSLHYHDNAKRSSWVVEMSPEVAKVRASAGECRIYYDWLWVRDGTVDFQQHAYVTLKEVREIEVVRAEEATREFDIRSGSPQLTASVGPPVFVVRVDRPGTENNFPFYDEALAHRVADELSHAVDLCGGHALAPEPAKASPAPGQDASLEVTMKWIAEALGNVGPVNYVAYRHVDAGRASPGTLVTRYSSESTNLRASAPNCNLDWHARRVRDARVVVDGDVGVALKDLKRVDLVPAQDGYKETDQRYHRPGASYRVVPETFMVRLKTRSGLDIAFPLQDSNLGGEIVKALAHALQACGGGVETY